MSEYDDLVAGLSGGIPEAQTTEAISAPAKNPELDAGERDAAPVAHRREPRQPARRKPKRAPHVSPALSSGRQRSQSPQSGGGAQCSAYAPAGTTCKLCGKVHTPLARPTTLDARGVSLDAQVGKIEHEVVRTDFKKGR